MPDGLAVIREISKVTIPVFLGDLSDHPAGVSGGNAPGGNVLRHDATGADDRVVPDADAGQDHDVSADPDVVPDRHVDSVLIERVSRGRVERVSGGINGDVRGELAVVADPHFAHVQDRAVVIGEEILPDFDVFSVIAVERRVDPGVVGLSEKLLNNGLKPLIVRAVHGVELVGEPAGRGLLLHDGIVRDIQHAAVSALLICHKVPPFPFAFFSLQILTLKVPSPEG